jgi:hypothetical protein
MLSLHLGALLRLNAFDANGRAARYGEQHLHIATLDGGNAMVYMICPRSIEGQVIEARF